MRTSSLAAAVLSLAATVYSAQSNLTKPLSSSNILPSNFQPPQVFKNANLVHVIDLGKSYAKETINVVVENVASEPQDEYYIPFTSEQMEKVGGLEVRDKKDADSPPFHVEIAEFDTESDTQFYRVRLPSPLAPKAQQTLTISYSVLSSVHPLPAAIKQLDSQYLTYSFSAYCPSAYLSTKQNTEVKFPTGDIPEYTIIPGDGSTAESPQRQGTKFTYGPFGEVPAGAVEPVRVRYEFTKPLIDVSRLERDIEVSHWGGNVAFEERYTLHNRAANLTDNFNRVAYASSQYYNPPTHAMKELRYPLKVGSQDPYYTDVIGNVSTSRFRSNKREAMLELKPRYPVFGGWNYPFRVGWNADAKKFLRKLTGGDSYVLNVPFLEGFKQAEGLQYQNVEVRVILPEGAENVKYHTSLPITSESISLHKTFMDTKGRTMLTLTARNLVDDNRDVALIVTYDYPFMAMLRKPLVIFGSVLALFAAAWGVGSLDMRIGAKKVVNV